MDSDLIKTAQTALSAAGFELELRVPLSELGSFRLGGPSGGLVRVGTPEDLKRLRLVLKDCEVPVVLIGEGSNILFSDLGWQGLVVRYVEEEALPEQLDANQWRISGAANLDWISEWAAEKGLAGMEAFTGIPGTVGGAIVGNAGAWGIQMEQVLVSVTVIDPSGEVLNLSVEDCGFAYRDSSLKRTPCWVMSCVVQLHPDAPVRLLAEREQILSERAARHPDWRETPCIGSFFRNLEPTSKAERRQAAGWFLEKAGVKDFREGGAGIFAKHANIPVKVSDSCRATDVAALAARMQSAVRELHGLNLIREVRYLGEFPGEALHNGFH